MSNQKIDSDDIYIKDVFKSFYLVPDYQREYVWESEQVEQLLNDINTGFSAETKNTPEYFIGSIVVCPREKNIFELIDGQQRMTTLFLIICAIRDYIHPLDEEYAKNIERQIIDTDTDTSGMIRNLYRVELQYEDSSNVLKEIAQGNFSEHGNKNTRSVKNIGVAYNTIIHFLKDFSEDVDAIKKLGIIYNSYIFRLTFT